MKPRSVALALLAGSLVVPLGSQAATAPFEPFVGEYVGLSVAENPDGIGVQDVGVKIAASQKGFTVTWTVVQGTVAGRMKRGEYAVEFQPTARANIYSSAMAVDVFGNRVPLDPLRGDPYVWARIQGATLTVYALLITDDAGYEMHTYDRTLSAQGLLLTHSRVRDGTVLQTVTGVLRKVH